jgi:hypothetical protein
MRGRKSMSMNVSKPQRTLWETDAGQSNENIRGGNFNNCPIEKHMRRLTRIAAVPQW